MDTLEDWVDVIRYGTGGAIPGEGGEGLPWGGLDPEPGALVVEIPICPQISLVHLGVQVPGPRGAIDFGDFGQGDYGGIPIGQERIILQRFGVTLVDLPLQFQMEPFIIHNVGGYVGGNHFHGSQRVPVRHGGVIVVIEERVLRMEDGGGELMWLLLSF